MDTNKHSTLSNSNYTPSLTGGRGRVSSLELLSPAKTADIGIEAIRHGADAVYIGAAHFGARAAAGNSIEDIQRLVQFAHLYMARVYVTVNTIIYDDEVEQVEKLIWKLYNIKVDALIIQDMRILAMNLPPIPLHASTQMDNRTVEKVQSLAALGFPQVVLARELTTEQISAIHQACPDTELEVFVHGALCVGLSGRCNASEALFGRSANRGECAQVCRMKFELIAPQPPKGAAIQQERKEHVLIKGKHLLSLKDNCQINNLEKLLEAGASSFKIEGRLKDADYVKNITAAYSRALDAVIAKHPDKYCRRASGHINLKFEPNIWKSFNRGFVTNVNKPEANFDTPKSLGEPLWKPAPTLPSCRENRYSEPMDSKGHPIQSNRNHTPSPKEVSGWVSKAGASILHNGDGLCYIDAHGELQGFRIGNVDRFRPTPGIKYYRNQDIEWDRLLSKPSGERRIYVDIVINEHEVRMTDEDGFEAAITPLWEDGEPELARTHQTENIQRQLSRLGDTPFEVRTIDVQFRKNYFIPSSLLSSWRRELTDHLVSERLRYYPQVEIAHTPKIVTSAPPLGDGGLPFELTHDKDTPLMICHHCIRRQLGQCLKTLSPTLKTLSPTLPLYGEGDQQHSHPAGSPHRGGDVEERDREGLLSPTLFLRLGNGKLFRLEFDCKNCLMKVYLA